MSRGVATAFKIVWSMYLLSCINGVGVNLFYKSPITGSFTKIYNCLKQSYKNKGLINKDSLAGENLAGLQ